MQVKKEVFEKCKKMIETELSHAQTKLRMNKGQINSLAKEQRILKAQIGALYKMLRDFKMKNN